MTAANWVALGFVALGGALGSVARAVVGMLLPAGILPWATVAVNIVGSFAIGWLMGRLTEGGGGGPYAHSFWVVGMCGGFTTFSSFSWQTLDQIHRGQWWVATTHVLLSVLVCLGATALGWKFGRA